MATGGAEGRRVPTLGGGGRRGRTGVGNHGNPGSASLRALHPDPTPGLLHRRLGARGHPGARAAVPPGAVRGRAATHRAEEPSVQPSARPDGGRPTTGEERVGELWRPLPSPARSLE